MSRTPNRYLTFSKAIVFACSLVVGPAAQADINSDFRSWLYQDVWSEARSEGVSSQVFQEATRGLRLNMDLPGMRAPSREGGALEQRQAEFSSPQKYFSPGNLNSLTQSGRALARKHASTLRRIERQTGVPGRIAIAIWGRESAFGRASIPHNAFEILASKGFASPRAKYFRGEFISALKIVQEGHVPAGRMKSSWAGALGQPQFMPSSFLEHAADGDGDGRADIWSSEADTLASIASYLEHHGWQSGRDWGFEVNVPRGVSCTLEGPDQGRPIRDWAAMGITRVSGKPFPDHELRGEGYLMMPAGRLGPAFIVTPNFYVLKAYNMSDLYALFVGHVGDRIQYGMGDFQASWGSVDRLYRSDVAKLQRALESQGHDVGGADGLAGFKTRRSIGRWQEAQGRQATCFPNRSMVP